MFEIDCLWMGKIIVSSVCSFIFHRLGSKRAFWLVIFGSHQDEKILGKSAMTVLIDSTVMLTHCNYVPLRQRAEIDSFLGLRHAHQCMSLSLKSELAIGYK